MSLTSMNIGADCTTAGLIRTSIMSRVVISSSTRVSSRNTHSSYVSDTCRAKAHRVCPASGRRHGWTSRGSTCRCTGCQPQTEWSNRHDRPTCQHAQQAACKHTCKCTSHQLHIRQGYRHGCRTLLSMSTLPSGSQKNCPAAPCSMSLCSSVKGRKRPRTIITFFLYLQPAGSCEI
jgi:hypothetical protein